MNELIRALAQEKWENFLLLDERVRAVKAEAGSLCPLFTYIQSLNKENVTISQ